MEKFKRNGVILFDLESTYGTAATITGADVVEAKNIRVSPMEGQDIDRALEKPFMGSTGSIPVGVHQKIDFEVELSTSGTAGTVPAWGKLLRACGCAETINAGTSVVYNRVSTGFEAGTLDYVLDGTRLRMVGSRGTAMINFTAQQLPMIKVSMTGLYVGPVEAAAPTPDYSAWTEPLVATMANTPTLTIGAWSNPVMRSLEIDLANTITPRFLIGAESILISDRADRITCQVQAVPLTTFDPFAAALARTQNAVQLVHGTQAGDIVTLDVPRAQIQRPGQPADQDNIVEWPLSFLPLPDTGGDEWTLTLT